LDEKETNGKSCIKVHPHTMKQKQFLCQTGFMTQPLSNSHCYVTWVDQKKILETVVVRSTHAWKKVWECGLRNVNMVGNKPIWAVVTFSGSHTVAGLCFLRLSLATVYFSFASKTVGNMAFFFHWHFTCPHTMAYQQVKGIGPRLSCPIPPLFSTFSSSIFLWM